MTAQTTGVGAYAMSLAQKIAAREARVGIIGLGYVGLPLAVEFAKAGFLVTGIDLDRRKATMINAGTSYVQDVPAEEVRTAVEQGRLSATADLNVARESKVVGGMTPACTEMGVRFYSQVLKEVAARVVDAGGGDW